MKKYQSHKIVEASKINAISYTALPILHLEKETIAVSPHWLDKHDPVVGGYFVRYEDGYESYSPAEAFESGYKEI